MPQTLTRAWQVAATVLDPELPVVTIEDLGILRDVAEYEGARVHVQITPTYSGCPAMETIRTDLIDALCTAGYAHVDVEFVLSPPWTTDWITDEGRAKLEEYGVAPPGPAPGRCSWSWASAARSAGASTPASPAGSARPPARRSGCARPARSRSTTSSLCEAAVSATLHPLKVAAIDELTDDSVAITFEVRLTSPRTTGSGTASTSRSAAVTTSGAATPSAHRRRAAPCGSA